MLVDLSYVATEQKGTAYENIENLVLEEQYERLLQGMIHAALVVKNNKEAILTAVKRVQQQWKNIPIQKKWLYIAGAGTSGRLAAITAVEMMGNEQFHTSFDMAGGSLAFQIAVEGAEDNDDLAKADAFHRNMDQNTIVIGLSASGRTPYAITYLKEAKTKGALTIAIDNSPDSQLSKAADLTISNNTGPECPRGSTRMKAGTSQYITLKLFKRLLDHDDVPHSFDRYIKDLEYELLSVKKFQDGFLKSARHLYSHITNSKGHIIYVGQGTRGLLGVIDGSELGPTYSWTRVAYDTPALSKILDKPVQPSIISPHDFVIFLDEKIETPCPQVDLSRYSDVTANIMLKILTTLFALQSKWILEGEMLHLDPKNPNKKLVARRVQILKNLSIAQTDQQALEILKIVHNDLVLAVNLRSNSSLKTVQCDLVQRQSDVL